MRCCVEHDDDAIKRRLRKVSDLTDRLGSGARSWAGTGGLRACCSRGVACASGRLCAFWGFPSCRQHSTDDDGAVGVGGSHARIRRVEW